MRKEIPILFSTPMVQALLEGHKTQTRRIIKIQPDENGADYMKNAPLDWEQIYKEEWKPWHWDTEDGERITAHCPYGEAGDLLWVRERWRVVGWDFEDAGSTIQYADGSTIHKELFAEEDYEKEMNFHIKCCDIMERKCEPAVDEEEENFSWTKEQIEQHMPWRPSIHMPKAAARIWLEVVSVRVERLQQIDPNDCVHEGVKSYNEDYTSEEGAVHADYENYTWTPKKENDQSYPDRFFPTFANPYDSFRTLWESINGAESWDANPWVWVVKFKRVEKP